MSVTSAFTGFKTKPVRFNFLSEQIVGAGKIEKTVASSVVIDAIVQEQNPVTFQSGGVKILYDKTQLVIYVPKRVNSTRDFAVGDTVEVDGKILVAEDVVFRDEGGFTKIVTEAVTRR